MKYLYWIIGIIVVLAIAFYALNAFIYTEKQGDSSRNTMATPSVSVIPIEHATAVIRWDNDVIYVDPTGGVEAFAGQPAANVVLVTDVHGDHLSTSTLAAVRGSATIIAPQAVIDQLTPELASVARPLANGETTAELDFDITGVPMYNLPGSANAQYHEKGRGNGYVIERDGFRLYIAGDTAGTPEMRSMTDIDIALVPMNLPYTMDIEEAVSAVLEFAPKQVIPYHFRGQEGFSDVNQFKALVNAGNPDIQVSILDWYSE